MDALKYADFLSTCAKIRVEKGLSQVAMAARFGVSPYAIINFENGRSERFRTALLYGRLSLLEFEAALAELCSG